MSNYATLKSAIQSAVYTNGNGEITGAGLQAVLLQIVNTVGDGYVFKGVATGGTSPGTPDDNVFYIAPAGTYTNFGSSYTVPMGGIGLFSYNGSWSKTTIQVANNIANKAYVVEKEPVFSGTTLTIPAQRVWFSSGVPSQAGSSYEMTSDFVCTRGSFSLYNLYFDKSLGTFVQHDARMPLLLDSDQYYFGSLRFLSNRFFDVNTVSYIADGVRIYNGADVSQLDIKNINNVFFGNAQNLWTATTQGGYYNASGVLVSDANYNSCQLTLTAGKTYCVVCGISTQYPLTIYVRIYTESSGTLTQVEAIPISPSAGFITYECPNDGSTYVMQVPEKLNDKITDCFIYQLEKHTLIYELLGVLGKSIETKANYKRRNYFNTSVDTTNFLETDFEEQNINDHETPAWYQDDCVLYLPKSYKAGGTPTKLIVYCKPGATHISESSDTVLTDTKIMRYMLSLGYGILAADGVPDGWKDALGLAERAVGNYVAVQSTIRAFDYVKENYNIDADNVFLFGFSQGGHYAMNVLDNSNIPFAAFATISPACSMRYHQWDLAQQSTIDGVTYTRSARLNIARMFGYPAFSTNEELLALEFDPSKEIGYDPWTRNVENPYEGFVQQSPYGTTLWCLPTGTTIDDITMKKHIKCPTKVFASKNDALLGSDVMRVLVKAIKNSGQVCDLQYYASGGHSMFNNQSPIGAFVENGESQNILPVGYDVALWFYRFGGYMPTITQQMDIGQGLVVVTTENKGRFIRSATRTTRLSGASSVAESVASGIYIDSGKTITLYGLDGVDGAQDKLKVDAAYGTNATTPVVVGATGGDAAGCVGLIGGGTSPFPLNNSSPKGFVSYTNNTGAGYYYYFSFAGQGGSEVISPDNYQVFYEIK